MLDALHFPREQKPRGAPLRARFRQDGSFIARKAPPFFMKGRQSSDRIFNLATARAETAPNFSRYWEFAASSSARPQIAVRLSRPVFFTVSEIKFTFFPVLSSAVTLMSGRIIAKGKAGSPAPLPTSRREVLSGIYFVQTAQSAIFFTAASNGSLIAVRFIYSLTRKSSDR